MPDASARAAKMVGALPARLRAGRIGALLTQRAVSALIVERRFDEADDLATAGLAAWPHDPRLLAAYAMSAHARGAFVEAIARWSRAREAGAPEPRTTALLAANLRELGRHPEARLLVDEALTRYPDDLMVLTEGARLARDTHRPAEALALWRRAIRRARPHPDWLQGLAQSLFALGDFAGAERALRSARRQHPAHRGLLAVEGAILVAREDWLKALAFWTDYRRRFPDDSTGWEQLGIAQQGLAMRDSADRATVAPSRAAITIVEDEPMRRLVMRFESIGDSCEMGLVQRRYGAEPLGLLRWNDVAFEKLLIALDHRFEGMGEPATTELTTAINGEFFVQDRRWSLGMHTFLFAGHADPDDVFKKMCRRIVYLRDKLLEDLAAADKVFVYRAPATGAADLRRLQAALRAFGPVRLLGVEPVTTARAVFPDAAPGEVRKLDDGLFVGFISRPGTDPRGAWDIAFDDWTRVFARTLEAVAAEIAG